MDELHYTAGSHLTLTIIGFILLAVIIFTFRSEYNFLKDRKDLKLQMVLSIISITIMIYLTLITLLHWSIPPGTVLMHIVFLVPIMLVLAPIILMLRARAFRKLVQQSKEDRIALIREVQGLLDKKKEEKIREGKIARGEPVDEQGRG